MCVYAVRKATGFLKRTVRTWRVWRITGFVCFLKRPEWLDRSFRLTSHQPGNALAAADKHRCSLLYCSRLLLSP